jgi:hypothetical protein
LEDRPGQWLLLFSQPRMLSIPDGLSAPARSIEPRRIPGVVAASPRCDLLFKICLCVLLLGVRI